MIGKKIAKISIFIANADAMLNISHGNPPHHPFFGKRRHGPSFKNLDIPSVALSPDVVNVVKNNIAPLMSYMSVQNILYLKNIIINNIWI